MKKRIILYGLTFFCVVGLLQASFSQMQNDILLSGYRSQLRGLSSTAVRVHTLPGAGYATGFLKQFQSDSTKVLFVTAGHVARLTDTLILEVQLVDTNLNLINIIEIRKALYSSIGESLFVIADDPFDLMALPVGIEELVSNISGEVILLNDKNIANLRDLFPGQRILYPCYPLDLSVNRHQPLIRNGIIAGIDTIRNLIVLDADVYGGSSGSPVFIEPYMEINRGFLDKHPNRIFIGVMSFYWATDSTESSENIGIAFAVTTEGLRHLEEKVRNLETKVSE